MRVDEYWVEELIHKIGGAWLVACGPVFMGWQVYYLVLKISDLRTLRWSQVLFPVEGVSWVMTLGFIGIAILLPISYVISGILILCDRSERR